MSAWDGPVRTLVQLFLLGRSVSTEQAEATLRPEAVSDLTASGLLVPEDASLRPTAHVSPFQEMLIASDLRELHRTGAADFVLGPWASTRNLAACAFRRPVGSVLDLGCGSGALGALASGWAERVVATDINPRAVAFGRFNAELNDLENLEIREGGLFDPVADERFDLILCNPPYVISPGSTFVYRDGEPGICRRIVQEAPDHLEEGGFLQIVVEWPERRGSDWRAEPLSWLEGVPCDAWGFRLYSYTAEEHAHHWLQQEHPEEPPPRQEMEAWIDHLASLGATSVGGGLLVLRPSQSGTPVRVLREPPGSMGRTGAADTLAGWISAQALLACYPEREELLHVALAPAPGLESTLRREATEEGWTQRSRKLRLPRGFRFEADVDPVIEEIVGLLGDGRTPLEALERFAARHGLESAPFLSGLPDAIARLLELGLLVPADPEGEAF